MARRLRIQFEGALYHVINRGNFRSDVFQTAGAAKAFEAALGETCERHQWRVHAYPRTLIPPSFQPHEGSPSDYPRTLPDYKEEEGKWVRVEG